MPNNKPENKIEKQNQKSNVKSLPEEVQVLVTGQWG